jgi:prepilin-type N-terminal cleavage/methylation domain-containing protein
MKSINAGFTLVEVAIVLLIVALLLGYTVALFPRQQELKQYRALNQEMDRISAAIVGFAQVNGRLPCPSLPASGGNEDYNLAFNDGCNNFGGFVPVNTLGLGGKLNQDSLLLDPWGNPYRYYVTDVDFDGNGLSDFTTPGEMRDIGLVDSEPDGYIDLDGRYLICDDNGTTIDSECTGANEVFGRFTDGGGGPEDDRYAGAPFVVISHGKNWNEGAAINDELENMGSNLSLTDLGMANGPTGMEYLLKDVGAGGETTFVRRPTGFAEDFDDVVRWVSPSILYSKMIEAGQLP